MDTKILTPNPKPNKQHAQTVFTPGTLELLNIRIPTPKPSHQQTKEEKT